MANLQKPTEMKRLHGNPGHQKLPEVQAHQPPLSPQKLSKGVAASLEGIFAHAAVWLGETDAVAMALLQEMLVEREELKALIDDGLEKRHTLRQLDTIILQLLRDLGLNPIARSKIGLSEVQAASTLDSMRQRNQKQG
jgi:hypothetical protein